MTDIDLGTLRAGIEFDLSGLTVGVERATLLIARMGQEVEGGLASLFDTTRYRLGEATESLVAPAIAALASLKRGSAETREAIVAALDDIYRQTHNRSEVQAHRAAQTYRDDRASGVPEEVAHERLRLSLQQGIADAERRAMQDDMALERARFDAIRQDTIAIQNLNAEAAAEQRRATQDDMELETARFEAAQRDGVAVRNLEREIWEDRKRNNQEQLAEAVWEQEVAEHDRASAEALKRMQLPLTPVQQALQGALAQMREGIQNILGGAFEKVFMGDTRDLFKNLLQSFEQLLAQMAAKALAAGIVNLIFGGTGGFLGGVFGAFGFDDATNDRKAGRWGYDFASNFQGGISDFQNAHGQGSRAVGDIHVAVNIAEMHNHTEADMGRFAETLAWHVQTGLQGRFV